MNRELQEWQDRQDWNSLYETRRDTMMQNVLEVICIVVLFALAALFVWLCCAASDYHFA